MAPQDVNRQLYEAASFGDAAAVQDLLSRGPKGLDINLPHDFGQTALQVAAEAGSNVIVQSLIDAGANLRYHTDWDENTAAIHASLYGQWSVMRTIIAADGAGAAGAAAVINIPSGPLYDRRTCLHIAVASDCKSDVAWLLEHGADPDMQDANGQTAFGLACALSDDRMSVLALMDGRAGTVRPDFGWTKSKELGGYHEYSLRYKSALMGHLSTVYPTFDVKQAFEMTCLHFGDHRSPDNILRLREPACIFRSLTHDGSVSADSNMGTEGVDTASGGKEEAAPRKNESAGLGEGYTRSQQITGSETQFIEDIFSTVTNPSIGLVPSIEHHLKGAWDIQGVPDYISLVMPFFDLKSWRGIDRWRDDEERSENHRYWDDSDLDWKFCKSTSVETYACYEPLTLDEYCHPALPREVLNERNKDQVFEQAARPEYAVSDEPGVPPWLSPLLVVDQAWLWKIRDVVISTGEYSATDPAPVSSTGTCSDLFWAIGVRLANLIDRLESTLEPWISKPILEVYENTIATCAGDTSIYIEDVSVHAIDPDKERILLHRISDIREELAMIRRVLVEQKDVWSEFARGAWPDKWPYGKEGHLSYPEDYFKPGSKPNSRQDWPEWKRIMLLIIHPLSQLRKFQHRITLLDEDAERVEASITAQLDFKQSHASLRESHATAVMSAAVFGFTIITIVFTPLSFVMALFALPIDQFKRNQNDGAYSKTYIGKWTSIAEAASVSITLIAIWVAVEFGLKFPISRKIWYPVGSMLVPIWTLVVLLSKDIFRDIALFQRKLKTSMPLSDKKPGKKADPTFASSSRRANEASARDAAPKAVRDSKAGEDLMAAGETVQVSVKRNKWFSRRKRGADEEHGQ